MNEGERLAQNVIKAIETLVIPNWSEDDCPWCQEVRFHRDAFTTSPSGDQQARSKRLLSLEGEMGKGLSEGLYLRVFECHPWNIAGGSIFAEAGACEASVFLAVASALQVLRTEANESGRPVLGPRRFPWATVVEFEKYLVHTYTESIIRAAFLRATTRDEMVYTNVDREKQKASSARAILFSDDRAIYNLAGELAFAIADGKFPEFRREEDVLRRLRALGVGFLLDSQAVYK